MAEAFGKGLLDGVEVVGFDEILDDIRLDQHGPSNWFDCAQIDGIYRTVSRARAGSGQHGPPVIEIESIAPQGGKTSLLYLLTSIAVTEQQYGGQEACVAILDADMSFDVRRLIQQIRLRLESRTSDRSKDAIEGLIREALDHVYILKPKDADELLTTVNNLPEWFLQGQHKSFDRALAFVAIDSINALNFTLTHGNDSPSAIKHAQLIERVRSCTRTLQCSAVITTRHQSALPRMKDDSIPRSLRSDFPASKRSDVRLIVRRIPVRSIPSGLSSQEAARETAERMKIVALGRFECVVNEHALDQQTLQALYAAEDGFFFRVKPDGMVMEAQGDLS